jgi:hypothetical protein
MDVNELGCVRRTTVRRDQSALMGDKDPPAFVDGVTRCRGQNGRDLVTVAMHTAMFLEEGDKLSSTAGQKGVAGSVRPAWDMPYTADGITADVVMNPHAYPSRMTIGQLLESALGLAAAHTGEDVADGTPFNGTSITDVVTQLQDAGFADMGSVTMYSGATGAPVATRLFFGNTYYVRVRQMAGAKAQARARGPVHVLTQQPTEGRVNSGGLRVGEMEVAALAAHGAAAVLQDRLFYQSDYAQVPVCARCGFIAMPQAPAKARHLVIGRNEHSGYCDNCKVAGTVVLMPLPFATKLLTQELAAMHMSTSFVLDVTPGVDVHAAASMGVRRNVRDADLLQPIVCERAAAAVRRYDTEVTQVPAGFSRGRAGGSGGGGGGGGGGGKRPRTDRTDWAPSHRRRVEEVTAASPASPIYMPASPAYMPASPAYMPASPAYMPASPAYMPASSAYMPASPAYMPTSPAYMPTSPAYMPTSPAYMPASPAYMPASPAYMPASPVYMAASPAYMPASPPLSV